MAETIFESLEKDKVETGATGIVEKTEVVETPVVEAVKEPVVEKVEVIKEVENTDSKKADPVNEYWKDLDFESPDKLKEFINTKRNEKPVEVKPKFASSNAESYNNWIENGGVEDFGIFQSVNKFSVSDKPTSEEMIEALVLEKVLEEPEYKGRESILRNKIKKEYMLDISAEDKELWDEDEKGTAELKLIDLKKEFKKTAEKFQGLQAKTSPVKDETLETRLKENPAKLKEHLDKEVTTLKVDIKKRVKSEKGELKFEDSLYSINFDESMQKTFRQNYEVFAKENNFPDLTDGSHEGMKAVAMVMAIGANLENVMNDVYEAGLAAGKSDSIKAEIEDVNPTKTGTHEKKNTSSDSGDRSGDMFK